MADPYASRLRPAPLTGADGEPVWLGEVAARGGVVVDSVSTLPAAAVVAEAAFVAIPCCDLGIVPPLARLNASLAVAFLVARSEGVGPEQADRAFEVLGTAKQRFLIKHGIVAGPEGRDGARPVDAALIGAVLDAAIDDRTEWETDPNLGYETPVVAPGFVGEDLDVLTPRFLYARRDRVYGHAALVPELQQTLHAAVSPIAGIDPAIVAATGWPPSRTGSSWKDD